VVLPVGSVIDPDVWASLAAAGVTVLVGPRLPDGLDPGAATMVEDPASLPALLPPPPFGRGGDDVDLVHLRSVDGTIEVLAAANGCGETVALDLTFEGAVRLVGRWDDEVLEGDGAIAFKVEPWAVQVWQVER
jgi:hypothetical protein